MPMDDDWASRVGKPIRDVVPPAKNRGDALPEDSMKLREELIRKHEEKLRSALELGIAQLDEGDFIEKGAVDATDEELEVIDAGLAEARVLGHPLYADVLARTLKLPMQEKLDLIVALIESLTPLADSSSDEGS